MEYLRNAVNFTRNHRNNYAVLEDAEASETNFSG